MKAKLLFMLFIVFFSCNQKSKRATINVYNPETIKENIDKIEIDSAKIKELSKYFIFKKDEFKNNNFVWITPKSAPHYNNENGIYLYFQTENDIASNLRLRIQHHADDWLFFNAVYFSIDDKAYSFFPMTTETDSGNGGMIWEWCDESLLNVDKELIKALYEAKNAKMKLTGRQYAKTKTITENQILNIQRTIDLFKAMGGK